MYNVYNENLQKKSTMLVYDNENPTFCLHMRKEFFVVHEGLHLLRRRRLAKYYCLTFFHFLSLLG